MGDFEGLVIWSDGAGGGDRLGGMGWGVVGVTEGGYLGPALATLSRVPPLNTIEDPPNQG